MAVHPTRCICLIHCDSNRCTRRLTNRPTSGSSFFSNVFTGIASFGTRTIFLIRDLENIFAPGNNQLWETDGTPEGTRPLVTAAGGPVVPATNPRPLKINNRLYLLANDPSTGTEPAVLDFCPADYDNSGVVSIGDVLAFVQAWLGEYGVHAPNLGPDFDGSGVVDLEDLFTYLAAYFAGCR